MPNVCFTCSLVCNQFDNAYAKDTRGVTYLDKLKCIFPAALLQSSTMIICAKCKIDLFVSFNFLQTLVKSQVKLRDKAGQTDAKLTELKVKIDRANNIAPGTVEKPKIFIPTPKGPQAEKVDSGLSPERSEDSGDDGYEVFNINDQSDSDDEFLSTKTAKLEDNTSIKLQTLTACENCKTLFKSEKLYKTHLLSCKKMKEEEEEEKPEEDHSCNICLQSFDSEIELDQHSCDNRNAEGSENKKMVLSSGKIIHKCGVCGEEFDRVFQLHQHVQKHQPKERRYDCKDCGKVFKLLKQLRDHTRRIHKNSSENAFTCKICGKIMHRPSSLSKHMETHNVEPGKKTKRTPFLCTICGKSFPFSNGMQRHLRVHLGIKPHECNICHKRFNQTTHLQVHMRVHTGEKPYVCDQCGLSFSLNASLQKHKQSHDGVRLSKKAKQQQMHQPPQHVNNQMNMPQPTEQHQLNYYRNTPPSCSYQPQYTFNQQFLH